MISHYRASWHAAARVGSVVLVSQQGEFELRSLGSSEFHAVVELLRNERPIFFDPATETVFTGSERVGEEEID